MERRLLNLFDHLSPKHNELHQQSNFEQHLLVVADDFFQDAKQKSPLFKFLTPSLPQYFHCSILDMKNITISKELLSMFTSTMKSYPSLLKITFQDSNLVKFRNNCILLLPSLPNCKDELDALCDTATPSLRSIQIDLTHFKTIAEDILWNIFVVYEPFLTNFQCIASTPHLMKRIQTQFSSWKVTTLQHSTLYFQFCGMSHLYKLFP